MEGTLTDTIPGNASAEKINTRFPESLESVEDADTAWQWVHRLWSARHEPSPRPPPFDINQARHHLCASLVELRVEPKWRDSPAFTRIKEKLQEHHIPSEAYEAQLVSLHGLYFRHYQQPFFYAQHNLDGGEEAQQKIRQHIEETEWSLIEFLMAPANHNEQDGSGI